MEQLKEFLLDVWREACRHIEISESIDTLSQILLKQMPIERLMIRLINQERSILETLAIGPTSTPHPHPIDNEQSWTPQQIKELMAWCRKKEIMLKEDQKFKDPIARRAIPSFLEGDILVGPLISEHETFGLLMMQVKSPHHFDKKHHQICTALLEPFAVALENDHRLRQINALKEAAEADKRSLLTRLGRENLAETIVGAHLGLRSVMERVKIVARSDVPVLILGETGSGKEVIARAIHNRSSRAGKPFIRVNCGAIPPGLIDSELFGHEKGSFTGATATRQGWFERSNEGTLFLDEIGELSLDAQVRLLRVLQDGSFERVGGHQAIKIDVRIITATHRDLATMAQNSSFREDLWYRIAVFPIILPPLRERKEDIPVLAEHFSHRAATRLGLKLQLPTAQDIALLMSYHWPGNIREFSSVIDRAALLGDGSGLEVAKALGVSTDVSASSKTVHPMLNPSSGLKMGSTILSLDDAMKQQIEMALAISHGRIEGPYGAAVLLQINPHTLRARMRKLGIEWTLFRRPKEGLV